MRYATLALLLALSTATPTQAGSLGCLFFTPEQRTQFEYERTHKPTAVDESSSPVLTINGIVQKKGGGRTAWVNGKAQNVGNSDEQNPESLPVSVPGQSNPVKVKVGQKIRLEQPAQQNPTAPAPQKKQPADDD